MEPKTPPPTHISESSCPPAQETTITTRQTSAQPAADERSSASGNATLVAGHFFLCKCCPKKPKKFGSEAELRTHEIQKPHICQYCHSRFKNKNEAERHQSSLHLRRHSWSCAAISNFRDAFSSLRSRPAADMCTFCGENFPNEPQPDWDLRAEHLVGVHRFGECNQDKKFYRADHFRQHLKHSHAGLCGEWTNALEIVCRKVEAPIEPAQQTPHGVPLQATVQ